MKLNDIDAAGERLSELLSTFKLPTAAAQIVPLIAEAGCEAHLPLLAEIFELEQQDRWERRYQRLLRASKLAPGKTFESFDETRLAYPMMRRIRELCSGAFLEQASNVLCFGLPGTGKTHIACAIGHALVEAGHSVLFVPTYRLVQDLLVAKRDLELPRALRKLDNFELIVLDDIGYVQQNAEEVEVLFTLMAERYERRSMMITSNLVFSQWDQIFKNPLTTAAAIDRVVHHSVILEFDVLSYRAQSAQNTQKGEES
jgi:DNA replication protein DnaC